MSEQSLHLRLEPVAHVQGQYTLFSHESHYPVTIRPETSSELNEALYRLPAVLIGQHDPLLTITPLELLRKVGLWLWRALLPDDAPEQERATLSAALRDPSTPLLLTLPDQLAALPWELLSDPARTAEEGFVARRRPFMRLLPGEMSTTPLALPIRVLLLISSPPGLGAETRVDVESERAAVEQATRVMREAGLLHLFIEDIVTPRRVQQALLRFKPHIVHYIGHGGYNEQIGGALLWEDDQGDELVLSAQRLADLLRPRKLRAVLLHACKTGRSDARSEVRGIAGTLVQEGIPAVIAQQANFTYASSQLASEAFYGGLMAGQSLVEALFEVRQALAQAERPDWAVPLVQGTRAALLPLLDPDALPGPADPALSTGASSVDLPTPTGVFVGRHREMRALRLLLEQAPGSGPVLALLTGPGGIGKSTLVAQAVRRSAKGYKGILTLSCQGYQGMDLFLQRIGAFLQRLGAPAFAEQVLTDAKRSTEAKIEEAVMACNQVGPVLLVIDNLESVQQPDQALRDPHLLFLLQRLLTNLSNGRVLITGRYAVKDLLPQGKFAANLVQLSLDELSSYETRQLLLRHPTLARLGERVQQRLRNEFGGLPYVYDLLSSSAASQSIERLISDVQGRVTQERQQRSAQEWQEVRQQVIEFAALETATSRLPEAARVLLGQISVLQRPFPREAIEQGLDAARPAWQPLLDWSLLHYDALAQVYRLHNITRRYAEGLLAAPERQQAQRQLASWYEQYANQASHDLNDYLEAHRLLRAAGDVQQAGTLVMELSDRLEELGLYPLVQTLCAITVSDLQGQDEVLVGEAQYHLGNIAQEQGEYEEARRLYGESLHISERLGDQAGRANALHVLGMVAQRQGEYEEARRLYEESLHIKERLGNQAGRADTLHQLGMIAQQQGEYEEARRLYGESLQGSERLGHQGGRANTLHQLGMIAQDQGEYEEARRLYGESLQIAERLGNQGGRASTLHQLGALAYQQGNVTGALAYTVQAYLVLEALRSPARMTALNWLARIRDQIDEATFLAQWRQYAGDRPLPVFEPEDEQASLEETVIAFIQAPTWSASRDFLQAHPELLQPEMDALLQALAARLERDDVRETIEVHRRLLVRCREEGVDAAFAAFQQEQNPGASFVEALSQLCGEAVAVLRAGDHEVREELATRLELLLQSGLPLAGADDFLRVLIVWLREQERQLLVAKLQPPFDEAYVQMGTLVEEQETQGTQEEETHE